MGNYIQIIFEEREIYNEDFINFIEEYFDVVTCDYTDQGFERYIIYENMNFNEKEFLSAAKAHKISLVPYTVEIMENKNWLKENVIKFEPIEVEDFLIYGIHEKKQPKTNKIPIQIYAATAFGSEHQTTKGCLEAVSYLNNLKVKKDKVLDVGCGSGILSIAAAMLWKEKTKVFAVDIDDESVFVTGQNAITNNVDEIVRVQHSNGYSSAFVMANAPYNIIMSNILARPLIEMAHDLYDCLEKNGYCVLSGFVEDQLEWVVNAHKEYGMKLIKVFEIDNWRAVVMEK
jgi:ribosomal protein L11 methyltransferase